MAPQGVFVDCSDHWKGRIGRAAASWSKYRGGCLHLGPDGADRRRGLAATALTLACRIRLECRSEAGATDYGTTVWLRQENDPAPRFHFLEEGSTRLGLRVAFDLLDDAGHYHGDGRQDIWLYPEGDIHVTTNLQVVDQAGHGLLRDAHLEVWAAGADLPVHCGAEPLDLSAGFHRGFGPDLATRSLLLQTSADAPDWWALYWARDAGHVWTVGADHGQLPPFYASRWPTGMQQWARGGMGWACHGTTAGVAGERQADARILRFAWLQDAAVETHAEGDGTFTATLVLSAAPQPELAARIAAVQQPLVPAVVGGTFRCYTEEDGTYEVGQGDPGGVAVTFPADTQQRTVRLRYFRRKTDPRHRGGVQAWVDDQPAPCQLVSEGELTDDICVPMEMAPRRDSVDDVLVSARLQPQAPTTIRIAKVPGIQATYQTEITGLDLQRRTGNRRDLVIWSSRNQAAPLLELDLYSGAVHRLTAWGQTAPLVWEMPMAWFKSCGISRHHYCNCIKELVVEENGPAAVQLYTRATNPNQRAQSELWLRVPYDHPRVRLEVQLRLTVLEQWDDPNVEFSDIFPYPSRLPETWCHDAVLFLQRDRSQIKYSFRPDTSHATGGPSDDPRLFYALYPARRGNVLTLIENPQHPHPALHYSVCGNYVDIHVNMQPEQVPVPAGTTFTVKYVCELYGDETTTVDELRQIGQASLEAGDLVIG